MAAAKTDQAAFDAEAALQPAPRTDAVSLPRYGRPPTPQQLELLAEHSKRLETASPQEIIRWAVDHFHPKLTMATAFGPEGCTILHMLSKIEPRTYVFNLDTGYQFKETLELRDRIAKQCGIEVDLVKPEHTVKEYEAKHGGPVYKTDPDKCCRDNKISVLKKAIEGWDAWMSGIRRDQSPDRAKALATWARGHGRTRWR